MIVSASRRTDIPAFYARWFMERVRAGFCEVRNPFNAAQVSRVSLLADDVEAIVFWTRDPRPLLPHLGELADRGHEAFVLMTLLDNPRELDPSSPRPGISIPALAALARALPGRVTWRYDPIVLTGATPPDWHRATFARLAARLEGLTDRVVVSFMEPYRKINRRMAALEPLGFGPVPCDAACRLELLADLRAIAAGYGLLLTTCCQPAAYADAGIAPARCIDTAWIGRFVAKALPTGRDAHQRPGCGCAPSKDIGAYDHCLFGCRYCYATASFDRARQLFARHDPSAPSL